MSYCVNCGVKLKNSEKKCPLCNTKVINPNKDNSEYEPVYSNKVENFKRINYKYLSKIVILILMITSFLILLLDYASSGTITWSLYVVSSIVSMKLTLNMQNQGKDKKVENSEKTWETTEEIMQSSIS